MKLGIFRILMGLIGFGVLFGTAFDSGYSESSEELLRHPTGFQQGLPEIGKPTPPFSLVDLEGNRVTITDFHGRVVLLNFWATWCGPCRIEMPAMERLYQDFHAKGLDILAVSIDPQGVVVTRPFKEALGLTFPILNDSEYRVASLYGARTLPMTYIIDRQGIIRQRIYGARDWNGEKARALIQSLLKDTQTKDTQMKDTQA